MSRKKIAALIMSALVAVCVIGGSLAYFKSQDIEVNRFTTIGDPDDGGSDIDIVENFTPPEDVKPGDTTTKEVQVKNTDKYNQLIRVHFDIKLLDDNGNVVDKIEVKNGPDGTVGTVITAADLKGYLTLNFDQANVVDTLEGATEKQWFRADKDNPQDSYYYYLGFVSPDKCTAKLLDSVNLSLDAGNPYKGIKYKIDVIADGVQAANGAFKEDFKNDSKYNADLEAALEAAENTDGSVDMIQTIADAEAKG